MAVIGGVTVYELKQSFQETASQKGISATIAYYVPNWTDRYAVANALLGLTSLSGGTVIGHTSPLAYPDSPNMWATQVTIKGVGRILQGANQIAFTSAVVETSFGIPDFHFESSAANSNHSFDPTKPYVYATQKLSGGTQIIQLRPGTIKLSGATSPHNEAYGLPVAVVGMNITLHRLPYMPLAATRAKAGNINNAPFWGCATGTLRFDSLDTSITHSTDGTTTQDATYSLVYRPAAAWDYILDPNGSGWKQVVFVHNSASILTSIDFTTLFPTAYNG